MESNICFYVQKYAKLLFSCFFVVKLKYLQQKLQFDKETSPSEPVLTGLAVHFSLGVVKLVPDLSQGVFMSAVSNSTVC